MAREIKDIEEIKEHKTVKKGKIGVMTSGGDAPGMNAVIRAVVRTADNFGIEVIGIKRGYEGLLDGEFQTLKPSDVSNILNRGGTVLKTARSKEMMTPEGQDKAATICKVLNIETLIIIGGDGSLSGGLKLSERGINVIGVPATIDLDFPASDYTIGFDTAVNTATEAISKISDTSSSHDRCSIVEVMGRNCGAIALWTGLCGGAEDVLIPEISDSVENNLEVVEKILLNRANGKSHNLVIVAEGVGGAVKLASFIQEKTGIQSRATVLGHLQRGGAPTAVDRMHASLMGYYAVLACKNGEKNRVIIYKDGKYSSADIKEAIELREKGSRYDAELLDIIDVLSI